VGQCCRTYKPDSAGFCKPDHTCTYNMINGLTGQPTCGSSIIDCGISMTYCN